MDLNALATHLADKTRLGLTDALCKRIGIVEESAMRGRLLGQLDGQRGHLVVQFLACYIIDDTDFFGDGEIYWWSIPAMVRADGTVQKNSINGLPTGMSPHRCGDQEWMTNISLQNPPVWAVIPPGTEAHGCVIRLGLYDDDREPADLPGALTEGLEAYAKISEELLSGPEQIIHPVRDAIYEHLKAEDDDILIDQDVTIRSGDVTRFGAGIIGSVINSMARAYYFVRDAKNTEQFGPVTLHKGQTETVLFKSPIERGGRIALFSRGHDVSCPRFGELNVDQPFINRVVNRRGEADLANGFEVMGTGPAKFVAYYTPSYSD